MSGVRRVRAARFNALLDDDRGSTMPLILGYLVLAISLIYVCVCATDLYIAQKRLDSVADAAALAGADGFRLQVEGEAIRAELDDAAIQDQAVAVIGILDGRVELASAGTPDGVSARVTVRTAWTPPLLGPLIPSMLTIESTGTSRTALE
ncbi:pilus assembly protein TadG-related protein [Microbacterium sp. ASV81]|uniref:Pilus assembly protein TadG-related protein n=1 Tax=Microbacterium capsulatum TaxID=3041921 RepID=A0ABU0XG62_9MICO|nr:pilus assembly protein TadG-related protein [Microbacterium sp. ASV81]MDQ4214111.1 pilus assembly protein TadG-related protein [Microbacterium sp. ASV81]